MAAMHGTARPLVVEVESALLQSDLRLETFWAAFGADMAAALRAMAGPGRMQALRRIAEPDFDLLPMRPSAVERVEMARAEGRQVILATDNAAMGAALARRLDLPAEAVQDPAAVPGGADRLPPHRDRSSRAATLLAELRPLQWAKNALLLFPALAAHDVAPATIWPVLLAIVAFAAGASALYILNDLLDLASDRSHPEKRRRPLAAGTLPIGTGMWASAALLILALALAGSVGAHVAGLLAVYLVLSMIYSLWLKHLKWLDLIALSLMFLLRVLTGAAAAGVGIEPPLLLFIAAVFFTLASVKRLTDLARQSTLDHLPGRGYGPRDTRLVAAAAGLSIALALSAFLAYAFGTPATSLYGRPGLFALVALPIGLWLTRMVWLSLQGREDFDTLRFVTHDRSGLAIMATGFGMTLLAIPG